jgi:hypothetical protein
VHFTVLAPNWTGQNGTRTTLTWHADMACCQHLPPGSARLRLLLQSPGIVIMVAIRLFAQRRRAPCVGAVSRRTAPLGWSQADVLLRSARVMVTGACLFGWPAWCVFGKHGMIVVSQERWRC